MKQLEEAARAGHLTLLFVTDSSAGAKAQRFEDTLFKRNETVAIALKVFRQLRLDVAQDRVARSVYGSKVPLVIAFNAKGEQVGEVEFPDFRPSASKLLRLMSRTARGHGDMPLMTFVKKYRKFLNDLDRIEGQKTTLAQKKARAVKSGSKSKVAKVAREAKRLAKEEQKLLAREKRLLQAVKAFCLAKEPREGARNVARAAAARPSASPKGKKPAPAPGGS